MQSNNKKFEKLNEQERAERGVNSFKNGYNCSQAVVNAFADVYDIDNRFLSLASSFGGGMGRLRMTCGACSGMFMLAGLQTGSPDAGDLDARKLNYATVQQLGKEFKDENGSMMCCDLLGLRAGTIQPPTPDERNAEYYRQRPCVKMVESACRIYARYYNSLITQAEEKSE
ncbi:MAG: C-GCAxxG-C-C family protein [Muribaculaceae bacterium]